VRAGEVSMEKIQMFPWARDWEIVADLDGGYQCPIDVGTRKRGDIMS
jgi:hypothetical protein